MYKWLKLGLLLTLMFALVLTGCGSPQNNQNNQQNTGNQQAAQDEGKQGQTEQKDNKDVTITIGVTPWTSTVPPTQVAKLLLEQMGYTVKLQDADAGVVYASLAKGDVDVFMDSWLPDLHKSYMDKFGDKIDDVAISYKEGETGWVVPTYVEGFDSMEDLNGKEGEFGNKVYGIEPGAGVSMSSEEAIKGYQFDFQYVTASEAAMLAQAKKSIDAKEPVLFVGWRPHSMFAKWDLKVLKDPKGYFKTQEVHVLAHKGFDQKAPEAYEFLKRWSMPVGDIEAMILEIENGAKPEDVAQKWIDEHQEEVKKMMGE
jgi:glycine betaine/proline transport system substrate-binding protein